MVADRIPTSSRLVPEATHSIRKRDWRRGPELQSIRRRTAGILSYTDQPEDDLLNPRLVAISGPLEGTVRAMTDGPLTVGRDFANQVMIGDPAVSRKHCIISDVDGGKYELADLESHNGTFVNGDAGEPHAPPTWRPDSGRSQRVFVPHRRGRQRRSAVIGHWKRNHQHSRCEHCFSISARDFRRMLRE